MIMTRQNGSALRSSLITIAIVVVALAIAATQLPRGFSDDVSVIGQGKPVVVLVHNKESMLSLNLMTLLNDVRTDYRDYVKFVVVDIATDGGRSFVADHRLDGGIALVLFDAGGTIRGVLPNIEDEARLRSLLDNTFALNVT
jgi:thioredoxin-like negative regulator of GroEL